jgi:predicted RNase H-like HicB family nuclease
VLSIRQAVASRPVSESYEGARAAASKNRDSMRGGFGARLRARAAIFPCMSKESEPRIRIAIHRAQGCYFAIALGLPGCVARGATEVEALENLRATLRAGLAIARALKDDKATVEIEIRP